MICRTQIDLNPDFLCFCFRLAHLHHIADFRVSIESYQAQFQLPFADPSHIQQIVDQMAFDIDVPPDHFQGRTCFFILLPLLLQCLQR